MFVSWSISNSHLTISLHKFSSNLYHCYHFVNYLMNFSLFCFCQLFIHLLSFISYKFIHVASHCILFYGHCITSYTLTINEFSISSSPNLLVNFFFYAINFQRYAAIRSCGRCFTVTRSIPLSKHKSYV